MTAQRDEGVGLGREVAARLAARVCTIPDEWFTEPPDDAALLAELLRYMAKPVRGAS